jgi:hypothetical protein
MELTICECAIKKISLQQLLLTLNVLSYKCPNVKSSCQYIVDLTNIPNKSPNLRNPDSPDNEEPLMAALVQLRIYRIDKKETESDRLSADLIIIV